MSKEIYIVIAYKNGSRKEHSYTVAAFDKKSQAIKCAESHADYRGGKYAVVVEQLILNKFDNNKIDYTFEQFRVF